MCMIPCSHKIQFSELQHVFEWHWLYNIRLFFSSTETNRIVVYLLIKLPPLNHVYRAASSLPITAFLLVQIRVPKSMQQALQQLIGEAEPLILYVFYLLMGTMLSKYCGIARQMALAQLPLKKSSSTYCISSLIEIPPSFNMGVTNSARYNQIWGISMAISSAISKVSENL